MTTSALTATVALYLPPALLDAIAERAAAIISERVVLAPEPWIGVDAAAAYLACPRSRIYRLVSSARGHALNPIPYQRDGGRLLFRRSELDGWLARGGSRA